MFREEFDRQVENLLQKGYPDLVGASVEEFRKEVQPLKERVEELPALGQDHTDGRIPFVLVVKYGQGVAAQAIERVERKGKSGITVMEADDLKRFQPIKEVLLPAGMAYLLVDIDTGKETLNVTPDNALEIIQRDNRSPLTIEEGIALVTHYPESLQKNNCFSLPGSRCGDRRVAALWLSEGRPKLGWCWAGNPHTWLGSASCGGRVARCTETI